MRLQLIQIRSRKHPAPLIGSRLINYNGTKGNGDRMQLRLTYYRKQILYQYKVYYNISDPEEDQGCTSSEIQKGPSRLGWPIFVQSALKHLVDEHLL